jgi:hypothetical protein
LELAGLRINPSIFGLGRTRANQITTLRTDLSSPTPNAFAILRDKYQQKSQSKLSKVRLGERIAKVLQGSQYVEKSEPEKLIRKIHDRVLKQMNLEL